MKVQEIMSHDLVAASENETCFDVAKKMKEHDVGAIPIMEGDQLKGIITDRDIVVKCIAEGDDPKTSPVKKYMSAEPVTATPDMDVEEVSQLMSQKQIRRLPIVESGNKLVGMVSLGDLAVKADKAKKPLKDISKGVKES
jgi:CBS domain-containing protein